jgi:hypothetical protein
MALEPWLLLKGLSEDPLQTVSWEHLPLVATRESCGLQPRKGQEGIKVFSYTPTWA